jgi:hypothetical protein
VFAGGKVSLSTLGTLDKEELISGLWESAFKAEQRTGLSRKTLERYVSKGTVQARKAKEARSNRYRWFFRVEDLQKVSKEVPIVPGNDTSVVEALEQEIRLLTLQNRRDVLLIQQLENQQRLKELRRKETIAVVGSDEENLCVETSNSTVEIVETLGSTVETPDSNVEIVETPVQTDEETQLTKTIEEITEIERIRAGIYAYVETLNEKKEKVNVGRRDKSKSPIELKQLDDEWLKIDNGRQKQFVILEKINANLRKAKEYRDQLETYIKNNASTSAA